MDDPPPLPALLDWQQARREHGVPTLTVLAGPPGLGVRAWRRWSAARGVTVAHARAASLVEVLTVWVREAFEGTDAGAVAVAWVAAATQADPAAAAERVRRMTRYDLDVLWRELPGDPTAPSAAAAHHLLARAAVGDPFDPGQFVRALSDSPSRSPADPVRVLRAVGGLVPESRWPAVLVSPPAGDDDPAGWFGAALRHLEMIATAAPRLPVALAVPQDAYDRVVTDRPSARQTALAREGYAAVRAVSAAALADQLRAVGVAPPPPPATLLRLTADGLSEEAAAAYVAAAATVRSCPAGGDESAARSAAEQFLFERLESLPQTSGLFALNRLLPFAHGPRAAEADLSADRLKLVVEVDGRYYHLTPEQYRRDRRKDWLYQRHGYLALRFLAEDVVDDLGPVLDTILDAVALCRDATPNEGARP